MLGSIALPVGLAGCDGGADTALPVGSLSVMSRNLYLGADLENLVTIFTPEAIAPAVGEIWRQVQASDFPERAKLVADEVERLAPELVALQEVSLYRLQTPGDWTTGASPNATEVVLDFLAVVQSELAARGLDYRTVAAGEAGDDELPGVDATGASFDLRLTDRNVILARADVVASAGAGGTFDTMLALPIGGANGATVHFVRGYVTADVSVADRTVRVVNSHLEVGAAGPVQEAQARELMATLGSSPPAELLVGDFNSNADGSGSASYGTLTTRSGSTQPFADAWRDTHPSSDLGATCCVPLNSDTTSEPNTRIDLLLYRGGKVRPTSSTTVGRDPPAQTPSGLWPSDHLGVYGTFDVL